MGKEGNAKGELIITFKSYEENYRKEESDLKNNTLRYRHFGDKRFEIIDKWIAKKKYGKYKGVNANQPDQFFKRQIRDITKFGRYYIITWKPKSL